MVSRKPVTSGPKAAPRSRQGNVSEGGADRAQTKKEPRERTCEAFIYAKVIVTAWPVLYRVIFSSRPHRAIASVQDHQLLFVVLGVRIAFCLGQLVGEGSICASYAGYPGDGCREGGTRCYVCLGQGGEDSIYASYVGCLGADRHEGGIRRCVCGNRRRGTHGHRVYREPESNQRMLLLCQQLVSILP